MPVRVVPDAVWSSFKSSQLHSEQSGLLDSLKRSLDEALNPQPTPMPTPAPVADTLPTLPDFDTMTGSWGTPAATPSAPSDPTAPLQLPDFASMTRGWTGAPTAPAPATNGVATGQTVSQPSGGTDLESWARSEAARLGIDPETAVRVANSEGGLDHPTRQSNYTDESGNQEQSFGPYQLNVAGGLGSSALQQGIDPRNPAHARQAITYALEHAARNGWGAFHGAARVGIGEREGIGGQPVIQAPRPGQTTPLPAEQTPAAQAQAGAPLDVADVANRYGGGSYVFGGGRDGEGGIPGARDSDCSSFVSGVWRERGVPLLAHTDGAYNQLRQIGAPEVSRRDAQPGDVVFFMGEGYGGALTYHMGIYAGNGQILDQSRTGGRGEDGVRVRSLTHAGTDIVILRDPRVNAATPRQAVTPPPIVPTGLAEETGGARPSQRQITAALDAPSPTPPAGAAPVGAGVPPAPAPTTLDPIGANPDAPAVVGGPGTGARPGGGGGNVQMRAPGQANAYGEPEPMPSASLSAQTSLAPFQDEQYRPQPSDYTVASPLYPNRFTPGPPTIEPLGPALRGATFDPSPTGRPYIPNRAVPGHVNEWVDDFEPNDLYPGSGQPKNVPVPGDVVEEYTRGAPSPAPIDPSAAGYPYQRIPLPIRPGDQYPWTSNIPNVPQQNAPGGGNQQLGNGTPQDVPVRYSESLSYRQPLGANVYDQPSGNSPYDETPPYVPPAPQSIGPLPHSTPANDPGGAVHAAQDSQSVSPYSPYDESPPVVPPTPAQSPFKPLYDAAGQVVGYVQQAADQALGPTSPAGQFVLGLDGPPGYGQVQSAGPGEPDYVSQGGSVVRALHTPIKPPPGPAPMQGPFDLTNEQAFPTQESRNRFTSANGATQDMQDLPYQVAESARRTVEDAARSFADAIRAGQEGRPLAAAAQALWGAIQILPPMARYTVAAHTLNQMLPEARIAGVGPGDVLGAEELLGLGIRGVNILKQAPGRLTPDVLAAAHDLPGNALRGAANAVDAAVPVVREAGAAVGRGVGRIGSALDGNAERVAAPGEMQLGSGVVPRASRVPGERVPPPEGYAAPGELTQLSRESMPNRAVYDAHEVPYQVNTGGEGYMLPGGKTTKAVEARSGVLRQLEPNPRIPPGLADADMERFLDERAGLLEGMLTGETKPETHVLGSLLAIASVNRSGTSYAKTLRSLTATMGRDAEELAARVQPDIYAQAGGAKQEAGVLMRPEILWSTLAGDTTDPAMMRMLVGIARPDSFSNPVARQKAVTLGIEELYRRLRGGSTAGELGPTIHGDFSNPSSILGYPIVREGVPTGGGGAWHETEPERIAEMGRIARAVAGAPEAGSPYAGLAGEDLRVEAIRRLIDRAPRGIGPTKTRFTASMTVLPEYATLDTRMLRDVYGLHPDMAKVLTLPEYELLSDKLRGIGTDTKHLYGHQWQPWSFLTGERTTYNALSGIFENVNRFMTRAEEVAQQTGRPIGEVVGGLASQEQRLQIQLSDPATVRARIGLAFRPLAQDAVAPSGREAVIQALQPGTAGAGQIDRAFPELKKLAEDAGLTLEGPPGVGMGGWKSDEAGKYYLDRTLDATVSGPKPAVRWFASAMMMGLPKEESVLLTYTGAGAHLEDHVGSLSVHGMTRPQMEEWSTALSDMFPGWSISSKPRRVGGQSLFDVEISSGAKTEFGGDAVRLEADLNHIAQEMQTAGHVVKFNGIEPAEMEFINRPDVEGVVRGGPRGATVVPPRDIAASQGAAGSDSGGTRGLRAADGGEASVGQPAAAFGVDPLRSQALQAEPGAAALGAGAVPSVSPGVRSAAFNAAQGGVLGAYGADVQAQEQGRESTPGERLAAGAGVGALAMLAGNRGARQAAGRLARGVQEAGSGFVARAGERTPEPAPTFYSQLRRTIEEKMPNRTGANQVQGIIKGGAVKPDEVAWTGIDDWLRTQRGPVTKQQVLDFLDQNAVKVEEVTKRDDVLTWRHDPTDGAQVANEANLAIVPDVDGGYWLEHNGRRSRESFATIEEARQSALDIAADPRVLGDKAGGGGTRYGQYTLPGGENYRELLLTLPPKEGGISDFTVSRRGGQAFVETESGRSWRVPEALSHNDDAAIMRWFQDAYPDQAKLGQSLDTSYRSSHWDEPNVLAHVRFNDRTALDGSKTLLIEEVQSDWGQGMRKARQQIKETVAKDFDTIVENMKRNGVLKVVCD